MNAFWWLSVASRYNVYIWSCSAAITASMLRPSTRTQKNLDVSPSEVEKVRWWDLVKN